MLKLPNLKPDLSTSIPSKHKRILQVIIRWNPVVISIEPQLSFQTICSSLRLPSAPRNFPKISAIFSKSHTSKHSEYVKSNDESKDCGRNHFSPYLESHRPHCAPPTARHRPIVRLRRNLFLGLFFRGWHWERKRGRRALWSRNEWYWRLEDPHTCHWPFLLTTPHRRPPETAHTSHGRRLGTPVAYQRFLAKNEGCEWGFAKTCCGWTSWGFDSR